MSEKQVRFITQGCAANQADSEVMAGLMLESGYEISEDADLVIFNTCTVKGPTDTAFKKKLAELERQGKKVILTGCIPQSEQRRPELERHSLVGTYQITKIAEVAARTQGGELVKLLGRDKSSRLNIAKERQQKLIEIVPISQGCLSHCTFCKTKHARGDLFSDTTEGIVRHISRAIDDGARDVWLTSQDNSAYGADLGSDLASLLEAIISIEKDFMLRVGMGNPEHFAPYLERFLKIFQHPKIYKFLHIPVQAGSNSVLKDMKRDYLVEDFEQLVRDIRTVAPEFFLATDIICGFPTESAQDFEQTLELVKRVKPDAVHISRYWPRPGTPAAKMKQLAGAEQKRRTRELTALFEEVSLERNQSWVGWEGEARFFEQGKKGGMLGKNYAFRQILVEREDLVAGKSYPVRVTSAGTYELRAEIR